MKLQGLRVLDLSSFLPGPYLTLALADHGAEVIKVEPPGGDPGRTIGLSDGPTTVFFRNLNRGKKSVVLDWKEPGDRDRLLRLAETVDVFVESFRPGVLDRFGLGYDAVAARNAGIVYCSINAFGEDGPYRHRAAHDLALGALTGMLSITLGDDGRPALPGVPMADVTAGLQGLAGVLIALLRRQGTGRGDHVKVAMHDSMLASMLNVLGPAFAENRAPDPKVERTTGGSAFYRLYDTRDGRQIALAGQEMKFVERVLGRLGCAELAPLCDRPGPHQRPVVERLAELFASQTRDEALAWLAELDVCYAPVNTLVEGVADPSLLERGRLPVDELGRRHVAPTIRFAEEPAKPVLCEPALGGHTEEVLAALETKDPGRSPPHPTTPPSTSPRRKR